MLAMGPRDLNSAPYSPVHCSSHSMTSFQSSELTELPVVENGQLFAQRAHSARYAPFVAAAPLVSALATPKKCREQMNLQVFCKGLDGRCRGGGPIPRLEPQGNRDRTSAAVTG